MYLGNVERHRLWFLPPREREKFSHLTRRANQGHIDIIADIITPAPENPQRVFCLYTTIDQGGFTLSKLTRCILSILFSSQKV